MFEDKVTTEQLINRYNQCKQDFGMSTEALQQRAIEESGFKLGDIITIVPGDYGVSRADKDSEHLISRLIGKIKDYYGPNKPILSVKAYTRKRLKSGGWHATENERYTLDPAPVYKGSCYWKVIGHEELKDGTS